MPYPKNFEQAAAVLRKERQYENEIAVCEMYIKIVKQYAARNKFSRMDFYEKMLP